MCQKGNGLVMIDQNLPNSHVIEIDRVSRLAAIASRKMRGGKMKGCLTMLLKTNGEKMSETSLATMLMKTKDLQGACHDVDEKKTG
jgi:hypothetical protein